MAANFGVVEVVEVVEVVAVVGVTCLPRRSLTRRRLGSTGAGQARLLVRLDNGFTQYPTLTKELQ